MKHVTLFFTVLGNQNALPRVDESFSGDPTVTDNVSPPRIGNPEKNQADAVTNAFKFSDDQIIKLEQLKRNFQHSNVFHVASGKFSSSLSAAHANTPKSMSANCNIICKCNTTDIILIVEHNFPYLAFRSRKC